MAKQRAGSAAAIAAVSALLLALVAALVVSFMVDEDPQPSEPVLQLDPDAATTPPTVTAGLGEPAPTFTVEPLDGGEPIDFATFRDGRPTLVNFFRRTCVPCVTEMPDLEAAYDEHRREVAFLGLSFQESVEDARHLVERTGVTYPTGRDPRGDILTAFGGVGLPTTVLIAADGTIEAIHTGRLTRRELEVALGALTR